MRKNDEESIKSIEATSDPRALLATWANGEAEWIRFLVSQVLATAKPLGDAVIADAYTLFRQEKGLDQRTLPSVLPLSAVAKQDNQAPPLSIARISEVRGVNALIPNEVIEPNEGLTILFGENGTGKTGYARVLKALAGSRTADEVLGNISAETVEPQHAKIEYRLADQMAYFEWSGERGVPPFSRMAIFDSSSVTIHVDDALDYVYVPVALSLFKHVTAAIQAVSERIDATIKTLSAGSTNLLSRFPKASSIYTTIETLGASTDLAALQAKADTKADADERLDALRRTVAALESNALRPQITVLERECRVARSAIIIAESLAKLSADQYNSELEQLANTKTEYETFRATLFAEAALPAAPDDTWSAFIQSGEQYRIHLESVGVHADDRCLYCRQSLGKDALDLLSKYSDYLDDKLSGKIKNLQRTLSRHATAINSLNDSEVSSYLAEFQSRDDAPALAVQVALVQTSLNKTKKSLAAETVIDAKVLDQAADAQPMLAKFLADATKNVDALKKQDQDRDATLRAKRAELLELTAAVELGRQWPVVKSQVNSAKESDQLIRLKSAIPGLLRSVTANAKTASDHLINQNFDILFAEECDALRAPQLKVQFQGREGRAQRKKSLSGSHAPSKPSKVLSEGEQKVLAIADFLAEARLAGITAPVVFDDPVSSLDHRRLQEVAQRIRNLADDHQVIVFTHDIFFATTLLSKSEDSGQCAYYQITDENGKGQVTRATGPRWDSLKKIKAEINKTIQAARQADGEAKAALVAVGYDHIRAWCEVFTEQELLQGVTQRYQPNVSMTRLSKMKPITLASIIPTIVSIYEEACRYILGHSQPLVTLGVSPTLTGLEEHWDRLQECKTKYDKAAT